MFQIIEQDQIMQVKSCISLNSNHYLHYMSNNRLGEVRDVLMDLRNRVTTEEAERRQSEQTSQIK